MAEPDDAVSGVAPACAQAVADPARYVDRLVMLPTVGSTNTRARELFAAGVLAAPEPFPLDLLLADEQTAGRGRIGRTWTSGPRTSFLSSFVYRVPRAVVSGRLGGWLTTMAGVEAVETLRGIVRDAAGEQAARHVGLAWPNDVYWDDGKLGGILTEAVPAGDIVASDDSASDDFVSDDSAIDDESVVIVVGIGLNLFLDAQPTPIATSLHRHVPDLPDFDTLRRAIAAGIARGMRRDMTRLVESSRLEPPEVPQDFPDRAETLSRTLGRRVEVTLPDGTRIRGRAEGILPTAALLVARDDGGSTEVTAGDVGMLPARMDGAAAATSSGAAGGTARRRPVSGPCLRHIDDDAAS
ncbi:biotin--[acetyl-CoA-carboxylase] ligase [Pseudoscardovia radai]|uniref:biotin--[acetyl-CoA-carboxylase] ligase n=1 Tax=Pseudoscardovia radai TaxID=987066 RepID=UPI0039966628